MIYSVGVKQILSCYMYIVNCVFTYVTKINNLQYKNFNVVGKYRSIQNQTIWCIVNFVFTPLQQIYEKKCILGLNNTFVSCNHVNQNKTKLFS